MVLFLWQLYVGFGNPYIVGIRVHSISMSANMYLVVIPFTLCCLLSLSLADGDAEPKERRLYVRDPVKDTIQGSNRRVTGISDSSLAKLLVSDMDNYQRMSSTSLAGTLFPHTFLMPKLDRCRLQDRKM